VVFCSGKVYYDILEEKENVQNDNVALIRLEQLYPLPFQQLNAKIAKYSKAVHWEWVQEEPVNMGAWKYISINFNTVPLHHVARPASGSPATGSSRLHKIQQKLIVEKALGKCTCEHANGSCLLQCAEQENQII
jgi:2-oxoglutarate dehydrogenase E1 component